MNIIIKFHFTILSRTCIFFLNSFSDSRYFILASACFNLSLSEIYTFLFLCTLVAFYSNEAGPCSLYLFLQRLKQSLGSSAPIILISIPTSKNISVGNFLFSIDYLAYPLLRIIFKVYMKIDIKKPYFHETWFYTRVPK